MGVASTHACEVRPTPWGSCNHHGGTSRGSQRQMLSFPRDIQTPELCGTRVRLHCVFLVIKGLFLLNQVS